MATLVQCKQCLLVLHDPVHGVMCHLALNCPKGAKLYKILTPASLTGHFESQWIFWNFRYSGIYCVYTVKRQCFLLVLLNDYFNICHLVFCSLALAVCGYISIQKLSSQLQPCCLMFLPQVMWVSAVSFIRVHALCYIYEEVKLQREAVF